MTICSITTTTGKAHLICHGHSPTTWPASSPVAHLPPHRLNSTKVVYLFYLKLTWQGRGAPLTCHTVSKNMYIKLLHTKLVSSWIPSSTYYKEVTRILATFRPSRLVKMICMLLIYLQHVMHMVLVCCSWNLVNDTTNKQTAALPCTADHQLQMLW